VGGWEFLLVFVGVPVVVATVVVATMATRRRAPATGRLTRFESYATSLVGAGAMMAALFSSTSLISGAFFVFGSDPWTVRDMPFSGQEAPAVLADHASVVDSGFDSAWIEVTGLPTASQWMFYLEIALPALATLAISVAVAWLAFALIRERPFGRALPNVIGVAAIAVMIGGMGAQLAGAFARASVVDYLGTVELTGHDGGFVYYSLNLDASPIGWALSLALIAAAFRIGTRMQRDTDLLI